MENLIINAEGCALPFSLARLLPARVTKALEGLSDIEELRLAAGRQMWVRKDRRHFALDVRLTAKEIEDMVLRMCGGSLYAHAESICNGFIPLGGGVRVGVCGRVTLEGGRVIGVHDISSLCIRIPRAVTLDVSEAVLLLRHFSFTRGLLLYAPPSGGKTTYLRSLALTLASGEKPRRVAVVDTRDELAFSLDSPMLCLDILSGYPKGYGVEIATRTLGAEVILCDEIGGEEDVRAILGVQSGGVPLVASAHASSVQDLMGRPSILSLHRAGVFGAYLGISRDRAPVVTMAEDVDACL